MKTNILSNHTQNQTKIQLRLDLNLTEYIHEQEPVRLLSNLLEGLDYTHLLNSYSERGRNSAVPPIILFKIMIYAYMNRVYSSREIKQRCQRDIHFIWLLNGYPAPSHNAINRFRKERLKGDVLEQLFAQLVQVLHELGEIQFENLFLDRTKIEANANRYSFVWLRSIEKFESNLHSKIELFFTQVNELYGTRYAFENDQPLLELEVCHHDLLVRAQEKGIQFASGKGSRKTLLQRHIETCQDYLARQRTYLKHRQVIGSERTSYSKTDEDATFMRMKEDHMKNGQLKPAYNIQLGVEAEYIVGVGIYQKATDTPTLIPFLQKLEKMYRVKFKNVIADAGYESEENYQFLARDGYQAYIKPVNYEQQKTRTFQKQIWRRENMAYDERTDRYQCANGQWLRPIMERQKRNRTGYVSRVTVYESESCLDCPLRAECSKAKLNETPKQIEVSKSFVAKRAQSLTNIQSEQGIILRKNRSIQVEGAFGVVKQDYGFRRFLTRGKVGVMTEFLLLCFSYNVKKLHAKITRNRLGAQLHSQMVG